MIRIIKSEHVPASLQVADCSKYDGQDVQKTLYNDHKGKCYLCEQYTKKDYQVEHFKAKAIFTDSKYTWNNLLLSCGYCNSRKSKGFPELLHPSEHDIEEIIEQRIIFSKNSIELKSNLNKVTIEQTIELLKKLLNGKLGLRDRKAEILYNDIVREITFFLEQLNVYKTNPTADKKQVIIDCLDISKEYLGIKYWIIKDNPIFYQEFKDYIIWHKTP